MCTSTNGEDPDGGISSGFTLLRQKRSSEKEKLFPRTFKTVTLLFDITHFFKHWLHKQGVLELSLCMLLLSSADTFQDLTFS